MVGPREGTQEKCRIHYIHKPFTLDPRAPEDPGGVGNYYNYYPASSRRRRRIEMPYCTFLRGNLNARMADLGAITPDSRHVSKAAVEARSVHEIQPTFDCSMECSRIGNRSAGNLAG